MEHLSVEERIAVMVSKLPILDQEQIPMEDACPICLVSFSSIVDGSSSSTATASPNENEGSEVGDGREGERVGEWDVVVEGVTKLEGCGHVFCRFE